MHAKATLDDYPALAEWYAENAAQTSHAPMDRFVLGVCESLRRQNLAAVRTFVEAFRNFLNDSPDPLQDFIGAETSMRSLGVELLDIIGDFGEVAIQNGDANGFFQTMQQGAEHIGLVVFRFLSAWTALNSGHPDLCAEECEKVTEPFASVHTIHGQALLELGRAKEAIEALDVATKLGPREILAWFQKAKAHHVLGGHDQAFHALRECSKLAPESDEVAVYMGMIAVEAKTDAYWHESWTTLRPRVSRLGDVAGPTLALLRLCILRRDKDAATKLLEDSAWSGKLGPGEGIQTLATTLRMLGEHGWMDVASELLGRVTPSQNAC